MEQSDTDPTITGQPKAIMSSSVGRFTAAVAAVSFVHAASAYNYKSGRNGGNSVAPWGPGSEQGMRQQQQRQQARYADEYYGENAGFYDQQDEMMMRERGGQLANYGRQRPDAPADGAYYDQQQQRGQRIQGGSRRQYGAFGTRSEVHLSTEGGRPLDSRVQMWDGPDNTSHDVRAWSEDGAGRPMSIAMERTDRWGGAYGDGYRNGSVDVANRGPMEYPLQAGVGGRPRQEASARGGYGGGARAQQGRERIQGGTVRHFTINPAVSSVRVTIESDGMPIKALVELLQGPGRVAQLAEVYNQHGRAFEATLPTPGYGSTIAVRNEGPLEYPFWASVEPVSMEGGGSGGMGGGGNYGGGGGGGYNDGSGYGGYGSNGNGGYQYN